MCGAKFGMWWERSCLKEKLTLHFEERIYFSYNLYNIYEELTFVTHPFNCAGARRRVGMTVVRRRRRRRRRRRWRRRRRRGRWMTEQIMRIRKLRKPIACEHRWVSNHSDEIPYRGNNFLRIGSLSVPSTFAFHVHTCSHMFCV